jgi:hypothetical protein
LKAHSTELPQISEEEVEPFKEELARTMSTMNKDQKYEYIDKLLLKWKDF